MALDRVVVGEDGFTRRSGIWGLISNQNVKFADVSQIRLISEESRGRRGRRITKYYFMCDSPNGTTTKVPLGNKLMEAAGQLIVDRARAAGIAFVDQTGGGTG
jgi:hypothetical protein